MHLVQGNGMTLYQEGPLALPLIPKMTGYTVMPFSSTTSWLQGPFCSSLDLLCIFFDFSHQR